jgi:AcrR family transcriptional regulator
MGLRERNAAQTRELILDTALPLFLERGYEATTMEEIAERADVGASTLYRYFPTKDALVLQPLALQGQLAAALRARPTEEPLDLALGHSLRAFITDPSIDRARQRQILDIVDRATALRQRLREAFVNERTLLGEAIAERMGRPVGDIFCVMTARLATSVLELLSELQQALPDDPDAIERQTVELAEKLIGRLQSEPPVVPRLGR